MQGLFGMSNVESDSHRIGETVKKIERLWSNDTMTVKKEMVNISCY